ncbi:MAG: DUF1440 domain-containing protein [Chloroflexota bacterium]|nr:DUF1440 domain-containing protein [Chloroflexota bacterium]
MTDTVHRGSTETRPLTMDIGIGIAAGVAGGLVFGALMAMMNMLPMIGTLVGSENAVAGFGVHMAISAVIGAIYGGAVHVLRLAPAYTLLPGLGIGLAYGVIWWILGPLLIMPTMMGMGPQVGAALSQMNVMSLVGHLMYGAVLGSGFALLAGRR